MANLSDIITPSNILTDSNTATITNKTISGANNTLSNINLASQITGTLPVANGGTGVTTSTGTGATVLSTSPTLVTPALGTPSAATLTNATGLPIVAGTTGTLSVARGGTGATTLTANNVLLGNGTSAPQTVAPSTSGNVLTSNGTTWQSTAPGGGGAWELLSTVTISTGASSLDITSLPSGYSAYKLIGSASPAVAQNRSIFMRAYSGATLISSGYNFNIIKSDTSSVGRVYSTSSSAIQLSSAISMSWAYPFAFEVDLINPTIASSGAFSGINIFSTILFRSYGYSSGPISTSGFAGVTPPTSSPINGIKLYWNGTTFNKGNAYVYGLKES